MEYAVQAVKVSENLVLAEAIARTQKTKFYAVFLTSLGPVQEFVGF